MLLNIYNADHDIQLTEVYVKLQAYEGGVFSCEVGVSSPVWGWGAAVFEPRFSTPAEAPEPVPEAAPRTAAPPEAGSHALEVWTSLEARKQV